MRHHTIPRFYLAGFSDPDTPAGWEPYVWLYEAADGRWRRRGPGNVSAKTNYYSFVLEDGHLIRDLEISLGGIENDAARIVRHSLTSRQALSEDDRTRFALFISTMMSRVPAMHANINHFVSEIATKVLSLIQQRFEGDAAGWERWKAELEHDSEQDYGDLQPADLDPSQYVITAAHPYVLSIAFAHLQRIAGIISRMRWTFLTCRPPDYFVTSDAPFYMVNPRSQSEWVAHGLAAQHIEATLPLTRNLALLAHWGETEVDWREASTSEVEDINVRTGFGRQMLMAPKTVFPGSQQIDEWMTKTDTE